MTFTDTEEDAERTDKGIEEYLEGNVHLKDVINRAIFPYRRNTINSNVYVVRGTRKMDLVDDIDEKGYSEHYVTPGYERHEKYDYRKFNIKTNNKNIIIVL